MTAPDAAHVWTYQARYVRAVDGDTVELLVDHGMRVHSTQRVRLLDVYAPERGQEGYLETRDEVDRFLSAAGGASWPLLIVTHKDRRTFERYLADVYRLPDGASLGEHVNAFVAERGYPTGAR